MLREHVLEDSPGSRRRGRHAGDGSTVADDDERLAAVLYCVEQL
jgi:hypothetical protein